MHMKQNIILAAAALLALTTACTEKFLTVEHNSARPLETYFTTPEHLEEAVVAAYDPLQWFDWCEGQYNPLNIMSDIMADQLWVGGADRSDNAYWHMMMNYEAVPTNTLSGIWSDAYSGVKRCNDVLTYIGWTEGLSESAKTLVEAQVRVLRAFYYNILWKFWGNIPYYEENLTGDFTCEQFQADEVYGKFIADLEGAIALNVLPMKWDDANIGRVSKAMAYMLYAEAVLYQNDESRFATALGYMKEIINDSNYELLPDFGQIFKESGEWSSESIFEISYKDDGAQRSWSWVRGVGGTVLPRLISPADWSGDGEHDKGWGFAPVRAETYEMYDDADARRAATCWDARNTGSGSYNPRYQDTGYFLEKYIAYKANNADAQYDGDLNFNNNLRIYRYAECLLNAAELAVRTGNTGGADAWLNAVHGRSLGGATVALTLDNIKQERRLEFVGEGKRYWDLIRWGDAATVLVPDAYGYRTNTWSASKKYLPFPQHELDATEGLTHELVQNNY